MPLWSTRCPSTSAASAAPQQQARLPRHIKAFAAGHHQHNQLQSQNESTHTAAAFSRRDALLLAGTLAAANLLGAPGQGQPAQAANTVSQLSEATATSSSTSSTSSSIASSSTSDLQLYENTKQQYRMQVPAAWERKEKAGGQKTPWEPLRTVWDAYTVLISMLRGMREGMSVWAHCAGPCNWAVGGKEAGC
jgi:hypothetical protein